MPKRTPSKPPSQTPSRVVSAIPDLSPDQRRDARSKNQESFLSHPRLADGKLTEHIIATALGDTDASPSEKNQAMTVISSAFYGKSIGQEEEKVQAKEISIVINGREYDPTTREFGAPAIEQSDSRAALIAKMKEDSHEG